jgi:hypothetical protein
VNRIELVYLNLIASVDIQILDSHLTWASAGTAGADHSASSPGQEP